MSEADARAIERSWGAMPVPDGWRACRRCGESYPWAVRYWASTHRTICAGCRSDERAGIWPRSRQWLAKNRWAPDGRIERRCCTCRSWKPLVAYYRIRKGVDPMCRRCRVEAVTNRRRAA